MRCANAAICCANAPHLVHKLGFVVPLYSYGGLPYYGFGLKVYEWLSGRLSFGKSEVLSRAETVQRLPTVTADGLKGGILYQDGQFDDARYAISLMRTLEDLGGMALNHVKVVSLLQRHGKVEGARLHDCETGQEFDVLARVVVNATGAFTEKIMQMDNPAGDHVLAISQGTHFVSSGGVSAERECANGAQDRRWTRAICNSMAPALGGGDDGRIRSCEFGGARGRQ